MAVDVSGDRALEEFYGALLDDDATQLYDRAPCGYLSTTPDGTIIKVNQTFLTLTGYERRDLVGRRTFAELLSAGGRIYHETHYAPMLRMQGTAREIALDVVCADGSRLPVLVNAVLERDATGAAVVIRTAVFDATERRAYERELVAAKERAEESEARAKALARTLQQTLIPPAPPAIPGLDIATEYRPAGGGDEVGGDFYDVFEVGDDDWVVVIGDVCGKGAEAAAVATLVRHSARATAVRSTRPAETLDQVNTVLLRNASDRFCTAALIRLRRVDGSWEAIVASAGHPLPLLRRRDSEPTVTGAPGSLLGVVPSPDFDETELRLDPGDALLLYTDGVSEARAPDGEFFGDNRVVAVARDRPASAATLAASLLAAALAFQDGNPRDDIAIVAARVPDRADDGDRRVG